MAYTATTIDSITNEVLRLAHEKASFIGTINRQFDPSFGQSSGKIGDTLRIRLPARYTRRQNSRVMNVQDSIEDNTSLVVATQDGVDMAFNSREMKLDLQDFSKQHLESAVATLISGVESDVLQGVTKKVFNVAGTAGTAITDLAATGIARARLNQGLAPKDGNRCVQMDSVTMGGLVNGLKGLFQDSTQIKEQYREGMVGRTAMADFYENERVYTHTNGSDVTGNTDADAQVTDGGSTIDMATDIAVAAQTVGSVFTIAGVYACHPETKAPLAHLQQFTATAIGATLTTVSPAIYLTGGKQNVVASDGTALATTDFDAAAVTFVGAASTSYAQGLMYHKDAFTFATAELPMIGGAHSCVSKTYDGISVRVWQDGDIKSDELLTRIDLLYGYAAIRPEWACRLIGSASA
jgi:hypothetical protein